VRASIRDRDATFRPRRLSRPQRTPASASSRTWRKLFLAAPATGLLAAFLTGCGAAAPVKTGNLVISATSVSFGSVQVGQTATATLLLGNNGSASIQISQIQLSSQSFSLSGQVTLPITLYAGQNYNLTLAFTPSAAGAASGSLTVVSTGDPAAATISLSGTGEAIPASPGMQLDPSSLSFGDVQVNAAAAETITITSSGTAALTIAAVSVTGSGFTASGLTLPATLNPEQTATLEITFDPGATGAVTGNVTLTTNASPGSATIALSGIGVIAAYEIDLTWDAPVGSADPPVGYNVFRAVNGSSVYTLLNSTVDASTSYADTTVQNGNTYSYYVESVDAEGNASAPSNNFTATIPD
jgi:hypothetical protein